MSKSKKPGEEDFSYEVIVQDAGDGSGDVLLPLPTELLAKLGWKEATQVDFSLDDKGRLVIRRI